MCGFVGCISKLKEPVDLSNALPWIKRRGPDSWAIWNGADKRISLLHARLAIVDKDSRAKQPFSDRQRALTIAYSGEIYNYCKLKEQLPGYSFLTESDTEIIIAVYAQYGVSGFNLLNGMFAFVLVDEKQRKVILVRDCIGKKPLFIGRWPDKTIFGSSVLALAAVSRQPQEINRQMLEYYWKNSFIAPDTCVLSKVTPVMPGQILQLDLEGNISSNTYLVPKQSYLYGGESIEEVDRTIGILIENSLKRRMANNPDPAVLLSGGIDSTLVCQVAESICAKTKASSGIKAISLKSFIPWGNDEFYARFAANRMKVKLKLVRLKLSGLEKLIFSAFDLQDEPLGMPAFFLLERLVNAASCYGRVLLTGDGADEIFLGYGKALDWHRSPEETAISSPRIKINPAPAGWMSEWAVKTTGEVLVGHMLTKTDRSAAEQAVEIRCPFLDWDLVSYARSLPFEILTRGGVTKALLKKQLQGWPRWFIERKKIGFAYNLRWHWGISNYAGLREAIGPEAFEFFGQLIPSGLKKKACYWSRRAIFSNFDACWRLLAWSRFWERLKQINSN